MASNLAQAFPPLGAPPSDVLGEGRGGSQPLGVLPLVCTIGLRSAEGGEMQLPDSECVCVCVRACVSVFPRARPPTPTPRPHLGQQRAGIGAVLKGGSTRGNSQLLLAPSPPHQHLSLSGARMVNKTSQYSNIGE